MMNWIKKFQQGGRAEYETAYQDYLKQVHRQQGENIAKAVRATTNQAAQDYIEPTIVGASMFVPGGWETVNLAKAANNIYHGAYRDAFGNTISAVAPKVLTKAVIPLAKTFWEIGSAPKVLSRPSMKLVKSVKPTFGKTMSKAEMKVIKGGNKYSLSPERSYAAFQKYMKNKLGSDFDAVPEAMMRDEYTLYMNGVNNPNTVLALNENPELWNTISEKDHAITFDNVPFLNIQAKRLSKEARKVGEAVEHKNWLQQQAINRKQRLAYTHKTGVSPEIRDFERGLRKQTHTYKNWIQPPEIKNSGNPFPISEETIQAFLQNKDWGIK